MTPPNKDTLLDWYHQMVLIRHFEETCQQLYDEKRITGVYLHLYSGHEGVGVGAVAALEERDNVITAYRDHGIAIARGVALRPIMAEMMGRKAGTSGGKGGSMHLISPEHRFWGGYAIVGGHLPLAAGIALESKYNETGAVTLCFIGDGATNNGYFHEALNMSAIWDLPVVWVIENNLVGMGTRIEDSSGQPDLYKRAVAFGMKELGRVDGQDVVKVNAVIEQAVDYARTSGPVLIEAMTYRYRGHGVSDRTYTTRFADDLEYYKDYKDPIKILRDQLTKRFKNIEPSLDDIEKRVIREVADAVDFAEHSPAPTYDDLISNVYVQG
jgi:pyruvate dehydrogenase E1 component alpha subunit